MGWETTYIHSDNAKLLFDEIRSLCEVSGWELVSVVQQGTQAHAFLKKPKGRDSTVLVHRELLEALLTGEIQDHDKHWATMGESNHEAGWAPDRCSQCKRIQRVRQALHPVKCTE